MIRNYLIAILFLISFYSCKNNNDGISTTGEGTKTFNQNDVLRDSLAKRVIDFGDTAAYIQLHELYYGASFSKEFFYYSLLMADLYNYNRACYETWGILSSDNENGIHNKLAIYYLLKSYEGNYESSVIPIQEEFGGTEIPSSKEYLHKLLLDDK